MIIPSLFFVNKIFSPKINNLKNQNVVNFTSAKDCFVLSSKDNKQSFDPDFREFLYNDNSKIEKKFNSISKADLLEYVDFGIPLKYSRKNFLYDINSILQSSKNSSEIFNRLEVEPLYIDDKLVGWNGNFNLSSLDKNDKIQNRVLNCANEFFFKNSVQTKDKELNEALNLIIKNVPEFINVIGRAQHSTHGQTLDVHILSTLWALFQNYDFLNLAPQDKTKLKMALLLHDVAKKEGVVDSTHPYNSSIMAKEILEKKDINAEICEDICSLIKTHHWLADYNTGRLTPKETAELFKDKNTWNLAQIMTEADLKGGSPKIYSMFAPLLSPWRLENITKNFN